MREIIGPIDRLSGETICRIMDDTSVQAKTQPFHTSIKDPSSGQSYDQKRLVWEGNINIQFNSWLITCVKNLNQIIILFWIIMNPFKNNRPVVPAGQPNPPNTQPTNTTNPFAQKPQQPNPAPNPNQGSQPASEVPGQTLPPNTGGVGFPNIVNPPKPPTIPNQNVPNTNDTKEKSVNPFLVPKITKVSNPGDPPKDQIPPPNNLANNQKKEQPNSNPVTRPKVNLFAPKTQTSQTQQNPPKVIQQPSPMPLFPNKVTNTQSSNSSQPDLTFKGNNPRLENPGMNLFSGNNSSGTPSSNPFLNVAKPSDISTAAPSSNLTVKAEVKVEPIVKQQTTTKIETIPQVLSHPKPQLTLKNNPPVKQQNMFASIPTPITTIPSAPSSTTNLFTPSTATTPITPNSISSSKSNSPNYSTLYQEASKSQTTKSPPTPPSPFEADYYQPMPPDAFKVYLDSTAMKALAQTDPDTMKKLIQNNQSILMKLFMNLQHYFPSANRQDHYAKKYIPTQSLGYPKKTYLNLSVNRTNESNWFHELLKIIISDVADKLDTDELIAHFFVGKALEKTRFYENFLLSSATGMLNISYDALKAIVSLDGTKINYNNKNLRDLINQVERLYYQDRNDLLETVLFIMNGNNKVYKSMRNTALNLNIEQFLWNTYKILGSRPLKQTNTSINESHDWVSQSEHQLIMEQSTILRLLVSLTNRYLESSRLPKLLNLNDVIPFFDKQQFVGSTNKFSKFACSMQIQQSQINLLFNLLPLSQIMAFPRIPHQLKKNKNTVKEIYLAIYNTKSEQGLIFKNLLPSFKLIYQLKDTPDYTDKTLSAIEKYVKNSYRWMLWLEVFLENPQTNANHREKFRVFCKILNQSVPDLWNHGSYSNIKKQIISLMKADHKPAQKERRMNMNRYSKESMQPETKQEVFELMSKLLGVRGEDSVEPVIAFMSKHLGKDFMYQYICKPLINCVKDHNKAFPVENHNSQFLFQLNSRGFISIMEFLTKCIIIHVKQLKWIEDILFYTAQSEISRNPQKGGQGIRLIILLFDCLIFFRNRKCYTILKYIYDALTEIIFDQTNVKLVSVAASICYYEYRMEGGVFSLVEKLAIPSSQEEEELKASMLKHLKALLLLPFVQYYFPLPSGKQSQISRKYQQLITRQELVHRYTRAGDSFQLLNDLCFVESAESLWMGDLLHLLKWSSDSISLEILGLILEKLSSPCQDYSSSQYRMYSEFIETLNKSNVIEITLKTLEVRDTSNEMNTDIHLQSLQNNLLREYRDNSKIIKDEEEVEIKEKIYFALKILENTLQLLQILSVNDPKQLLTNSMIQQINLVKSLNDWIGKKFSIYHYLHIFKLDLRDRTEKYNLIVAIASHFKINYERNISSDSDFYPVINLQRNEDTQSIRSFCKFSDVRLFNNRELKAERFSNSKKQSIPIRVLRVLTKCLLFWGKVNQTTRPSLYTLLVQPNTEVSRAMNYREEVHYFFKLMVLKVIAFSTNKDTSQLCEIFNFFITLLNIEPSTAGTLFEQIHGFGSLSKLLQTGISTVLYWNTYQKQHMYIVHKILIFLTNLLRNKVYKNQAFRLINKDMYIPSHIIKTLPKQTFQSQIQNLTQPSIDDNEIYNVLDEEKLYLHLIRYSTIECAIELCLQSILNNDPTFEGHFDVMFEYLYLGGFSREILNSKEPSMEIAPLIGDYIMRLELPYNSFKWNSIHFIDVNPYGYGRCHEIIPVKKRLEQLSVKEVQSVYSTFHKYSMVRSLEMVRASTLKRWSQFFIVLSSTGKYGYAISHSNKSQDLKKMNGDFGKAFCLLNTKMFKIQKGFEETIIPRIDVLANIIGVILEKVTQEEIDHFENIAETKISVLEMIFKWIYKISPTAPYAAKFAKQAFTFIRSIFDNNESSRKSLIAASLLNTLGLLFKANKLDTTEIIEMAIMTYLYPDCSTRNIIISSFIPELNKHSDKKYYKQLCGKMIALQLIDDPDPIDYLVSTKAIFQFQKADQQILLKYNYFSQLPHQVDLNNNTSLYIQLWRFQIVAHFLNKQYNLFQMKQIIKYLTNIRVIFHSILGNVTLTNFIHLPKYIEQKSSKKTINIEYLTLYLSSLKILRLLLTNRTIIQYQFEDIKEFAGMFFQNKLIPQISKYSEIEGEPLLKEVPANPKQSSVVHLYQYKKNTLEFMFEVLTLDCIKLYLQILRSTVMLDIWKTEYQIENILLGIENQIWRRLEINVRFKEPVKKSFECYHAYLNSVQTSIKVYYTNTLQTKQTYIQYIDSHRSALESIFDVAVLLIQKKENSYDIYLPEFEKEIDLFKNWAIKGQKKLKDYWEKYSTD